MRVIGLVGSLRTESVNRVLMEAAVQRAPASMTIDVGEIGGLPLFDADLEVDGFPAPVQALREQAAAADGVLLVFPEYNWSVPGPLKNAIDWLSRSPAAPLDHKPVAMMSAAGGGGGARAQAHMRDVLAHNQLQLTPTSLQIPRAARQLVDGQLTSPEHLAVMDTVLAELADLIVADLRRTA